MEFSAGWKSIWTVGSVYPAPLLLSGDSAKALGPLIFGPAAPPSTLLPALGTPPASYDPPSASELRDSIFAFHRSLYQSVQLPVYQSVQLPVLSSTAHDDDELSRRFSERFSPGNALQKLGCRNGDFLLLFPVGYNSDAIGAVIFSGDAWKDARERLQAEEKGSFFRLSPGLGPRILRISPQSRVSHPMSSQVCVPATEGFLLACTSYSAHWYRVDIKDGRPALVHLVFATFRAHISHACWSPHLPEESLIILGNGELRLFDLSSYVGSIKQPLRAQGTALAKNLGRFGSDDSEEEWWSCDFSWHPRIFIVACGNVVLLIDSRGADAIVSVVANIEVCDSFRLHSLENDRFVSFCKSSFNHFQFVVASNYYLLLYDTRQPLTPLLQWDHCVHSPRHTEIHKLRDLRPSNGEFKWASDSGFVILVGSFRDSEFSIFCYGPHPDAHPPLDCPSLVYAWELPSELKLSGKDCSCSVCITEKEIGFPMESSDEETKLSGFCMVTSEEHLPLRNQSGSDRLPDDSSGGFGLMKLFSSGKLEYQSCRAAYSFSCLKKGATADSDNLFVEMEGEEEEIQEEEIRPRFRCFDLRYLLHYLNGGSDLIDALRMQKLASDEVLKDCTMLSYAETSKELVSSLLDNAGVKMIGSPLIKDSINKVTIPSSIFEVACGMLWTGVSLDLLKFAFFRDSDLQTSQDSSVHFLDVPSSVIQFPPFFLRLPARRGEIFQRGTPKNQSLVGPVLPLPILLSLQHMGSDERNCASEDKLNDYTAEMEVQNQCQELLKACESHVSTEPSHRPVEPAVSLSNDNDEDFGSQEVEREDLLVFHKPQADCKLNNVCSESSRENGNHASTASASTSPCSVGRKFDVLISRVHRKSAALDGGEKDLLDQFDDLCPVKLSFSASKLDVTPAESKTYKCLIRQFSQWQGKFDPYKKHAPWKMDK
ncbi:hypothetical protein EJ110_NYTH12508 [Nymphaea thermarum]|nr:hypothetical protein EJ110_NYTH12508 [Nymphaea thermarum]